MGHKIGMVIAAGLLCAGMGAAWAQPFDLKYDVSSYDQAKQNPSYLRFDLVDRKAGGLLKSNFSGYVKHFEVRGNLDNDTVKNASVVFQVNDMDTGVNKRNQHMSKETLQSGQYPEIRVNFPHEIKPGPQQTTGTVSILGQSHPIAIDMNVDDEGKQYVAKGESHMTLSQLGIAKPKFVASGVASLDDRMTVSYQIVIPKTAVHK